MKSWLWAETAHWNEWTSDAGGLELERYRCHAVCKCMGESGTELQTATFARIMSNSLLAAERAEPPGRFVHWNEVQRSWLTRIG